MRVVLKPGRATADNQQVEHLQQAGLADRGDIVLGWLTRLTVGLALVGLVGFDLIALGMGRFAVEDTAQQAARAAVQNYKDSSNVQHAYEAALAVADGAEESIDPAGFTVAPDGAVTLTVARTSPTLLVQKVPQIRSWATSSATVTGRPAG